jgi:hypothetical protein
MDRGSSCCSAVRSPTLGFTCGPAIASSGDITEQRRPGEALKRESPAWNVGHRIRGRLTAAATSERPLPTLDHPAHTELPLSLQYDLSVSTFSPDGRVFQTDYAQKAVDNSGCAPVAAARHARLLSCAALCIC